MKVLVSDDHVLFREGMKILFNEHFSYVQVIEAGSFLETKKLLKMESNIELILLDIGMLGASGLESLKKLKLKFPDVPLVVISSMHKSASIQKILKSGADGFISKSNSKENIIKGLNSILSGQKIIMNNGKNVEAIDLSQRQYDIIKLIDNGLTNKELAKSLGISTNTARDYISAIFRLFDCDNRTQLAIKMRKLGYIFD